MTTQNVESEITRPEPSIVPVQPKTNQTALTIAIVSAVVLFFIGLGLGYVLGHSTSERTRLPGSRLQLPGDGDGRRLYPNSRSNTNGSSDGSSSTNTNTQTN